ncbi:MAG: type I 3-dehydroquinate dehydratase [Eubacteriales bacterium]|nr:type I 3-dehydroquinate dehydratase [Eubacteriales bacterium]
MDIECLKVRKSIFGEGTPKICVPIAERTEEDILRQANCIADSSADCVEFRVDWYENHQDIEKVLDVVKKVREIIGDQVLLFTFRSEREGGEAAITVEDYMELCKQVCKSGWIDLLDVEAFREVGLLKKLCDMAHSYHVYVVASNHDFKKTPNEEEMARRLIYMNDMGADIPKLAVMPQQERDVLNLLSATVRYYESGGKKPVITMSMGSLGGVTRVIGEVFGSTLTFATLGKASAPGQMELETVDEVMKRIHQSL